MRGLLVTFLLVGAAGCRDPQAAGNPARTEDNARITKLQEEEGQVLARRDQLQRERVEVDAERKALDQKRQEVTASGGDSRQLEAEASALAAREAKLLADEAKLGSELEGLLRGYQLAAVGGSGKDVAGREAQVAVRERDFARREASLAEREAQLAAREKEQARRERETCGPATAMAPAAPSAPTRYSRKDVEPLLTGARRTMSEKGLLPSDLPAPAKNLERDAAEAMSAGDFARARFAADQLVATVDTLPIDKAFIMAKIGRLNTTVKQARVGDETRKQIDELFRDATADYGDGKFAAANGKLNRIYALVH
jgi:hypothetical protein